MLKQIAFACILFLVASVPTPAADTSAWRCPQSPEVAGLDCSDNDPVSRFLNGQIQKGAPGLLGRVPDERYFENIQTQTGLTRPASYISAETFVPHAFFHEPTHLRYDAEGIPHKTLSFQPCPFFSTLRQSLKSFHCVPASSGMNDVPEGMYGIGFDYPIVLSIIASAFARGDSAAMPLTAFPHDANSDQKGNGGRGCSRLQTPENCGPNLAVREADCKCARRLWEDHGHAWVEEYLSTRHKKIIGYKPAQCQCWFDASEAGALQAVTDVQNLWWEEWESLSDLDLHKGFTAKGVKWKDTWNEIVMPAQGALDASFWDAVAVKLPAAVGSLSDLVEDAQEKLPDLLTWFLSTQTEPPEQMEKVLRLPFLILSEMPDEEGKFHRFFFCQEGKIGDWGVLHQSENEGRCVLCLRASPFPEGSIPTAAAKAIAASVHQFENCIDRRSEGELNRKTVKLEALGGTKWDKYWEINS